MIPTIENGREAERKGEYAEAELIAKANAFQALKDKDFDRLRLSYMLMADLEQEEDTKFAYLQGAYETSKTDTGTYIATCRHIARVMQRMEVPQVMRFIEFMVSAADGIFSAFLIAVYSRLNGQEYDTCYMPTVLKEELYKF